MPARAPDFPQAFVRLVPTRLEVLEEVPLQSPRELVILDADTPGLVQRVHHLAVHVELELADRRIADADRS